MKQVKLSKTGLRQRSVLIALLVAYSGVASPLAAEQLYIEEIVVTARKKVENLQEVPSAVNVLSGLRVERERITSTEDLIVKIPTFNLNAASHTQATPGLRGATSNNTSPGGDQSVGLFVDEVYYGGSADWHPDLFDVERIEVLRGPQGTLFGRNVVGGALNVVTRNPSDELEAKIKIGVGNFDLFEFAGFISGPLGNNWSGQIAISSRDRGGLTRNTYVDSAEAGTKSRTDTLDRQSLRAKLMYEGEAIDWIGTLGLSRDRSEGPGKDFVGPPTPAAGLPLETQMRNSFPDNDPDTVASAAVNQNDSFYRTLSSRFTWDSPLGEVVALTAYREIDVEESGLDILGVPLPDIVEVGNNEEFEQFSQEVRISSTIGERIEYTAGVYYFNQDAFNAQPFYLGFIDGTFFGFLQGLLTPHPVPPGGVLTTASTQNMAIETESVAAFVSASFSITDALTATVGVRYTDEEKDGWASVSQTDPNLPGNFIFPFYDRIGLEGSWESTTPKFIVDWKATEDVMLYASYSEGFKSGAFDHDSDPQNTAVPLDPEEVESTEIGAKTTWFDNRLQFNISAFFADYTGAQNGFFDPQLGRGVLINVGELEVDGIEIDVTAVLGSRLTVGGSLAFTESEVAEDAVEFPGNKAALTPDRAGNIWFSYDFPVGANGELTLSADYTFKSEFFTEISNAPNFETEVDGLVNARIEYRPSERFVVSLWGKNLSDERYILYGNDLAGFAYPPGYPGSALANMPRWNERRTAGLSLTIDL